MLTLREKLARFGINPPPYNPDTARPAFIPVPPRRPAVPHKPFIFGTDHAADLHHLASLAAEHAANEAAKAAEAAANQARAEAHEALAQAVQRLTAAAVPGAPLTWALIRMAIPDRADDELAPVLLAAGWTQGRIDRQGCRMRVWRAPTAPPTR